MKRKEKKDDAEEAEEGEGIWRLFWGSGVVLEKGRMSMEVFICKWSSPRNVSDFREGSIIPRVYIYLFIVLTGNNLMQRPGKEWIIGLIIFLDFSLKLFALHVFIFVYNFLSANNFWYT